MKLLAIVAFCLASIGCAPMLGAHVHRIDHAGTTYIKCTVVAEKGNRPFAEQSLDVCRDAFGVEHGGREQVEVPNRK